MPTLRRPASKAPGYNATVLSRPASGAGLNLVLNREMVQVWGPAGKGQLGGGQDADKGGPASKAPTQGPSLGAALSTRSVRLSCLLLVFQQLSGINAIVYFSSSVFAQVLQCLWPLRPAWLCTCKWSSASQNAMSAGPMHRLLGDACCAERPVA